MTETFDLWKAVGINRPNSFEGQDRAFKAIEDEINRLREQVAKN